MEHEIHECSAATTLEYIKLCDKLKAQGKSGKKYREKQMTPDALQCCRMHLSL
jgi:hypothetical protein